MPNTKNERTATPPATRPVNDCAWCGNGGQGICQTHLDALLAQSIARAATGRYRARDGGENRESRVPPQGAKEAQEVTA